MEKIRAAQRAEGTAAVLAVGTATPDKCVYQSDYPDYYFRVTNSDHLPELKEKFRRMCDKSAIKKRYMHLTEDMLAANPSFCTFMSPSLDARQDILITAVPELGKKAAERALEEWGQPKSLITHLIFCTSSGVDLPGADHRLVSLLGLRPTVSRVMLYNQGCFAGGTALRLAKDLAENRRGARVLAVCCEISTVAGFRGPSPSHFDSLIGSMLHGDGAAAVVVGADAVGPAERPVFHLVSASQTIVLHSGDALKRHLREAGLTFHLKKEVPTLIGSNVGKCLAEAFDGVDMPDLDVNELFWIVHPGGPAILENVQEKAGLRDGKLRCSWNVLAEHGNMSSACVLFILDEMRRRSAEEGFATTGEGLEWGVLFGFGPGLTVETVVLRSAPTGAVAVAAPA